jgi:hypothetical protein
LFSIICDLTRNLHIETLWNFSNIIPSSFLNCLAINFNRSELIIYVECLEECPNLIDNNSDGIDGDANGSKGVIGVTEGDEYAC